VVPDPVKVMHELARVTRPGGTILICNHFSVEKGVRAAVEKKLANFADLLGFRSEFPLETLMVSDKLKLTRNTPVKPFGFFTLLEFERLG
jgi:phosphatidylethanolamine/phosphatidyl-N-methylethanolamine N-methyltransferase